MSNTLAPELGLRPRTARKSDDYVAEIVNRRQASTRQATTAEKMQTMARVMAKPDGLYRLGSGMIGQIQLKLRYQGVTRNILIEDPITQGATVEYDVLDDLATSYILSGTDGTVRATPFEGKRVRVDFFRIAAYPTVRKEDIVQMRINMVEQAQDEAKQSIMKQEDARTFFLLTTALNGYATRADHTVSPGAHIVSETSGHVTPDSLYDAVTLTDQHEIASKRLVFSLAGYRDLYRWDNNTTGWDFKNRVVAGEEITTYGEFLVMKSLMVAAADTWLLPDPNFLGVFPVLYSLDVEVNNRLESFLRGWVMDEFVSGAVLNPRGIALVRKS